MNVIGYEVGANVECNEASYDPRNVLDGTTVITKCTTGVVNGCN